MDNINISFLKVLRRLSQIACKPPQCLDAFTCQGADNVSSLISERILSNRPLMIARFGANELSCLVNYLSVISEKHDWKGYLKGTSAEWWWNEGIVYNMKNNAGFFPTTNENLLKFGELMLHDIGQLDILASWLSYEKKLGPRLDGVIKVPLTDIEPSHAQEPWTQNLKEKKVLVVHPFADTIKYQYENHREDLYDNKKILPRFASLQIVRAVQSIGGSSKYKDWFEALDWMKCEIDKLDYEVCLIGCGAYGFPLAAHVKGRGKKAVHWGGSLQLLFGIKGGRWDKENMYNDNWIRPLNSDLTRALSKVEDGCYI